MSAREFCEVPRDAGYANACSVCGTPLDAGYFDVSSFQPAPVADGQEVELARHVLHPQYCGSLLYFMQYAQRAGDSQQVISETPGYQWLILCNSQPRAPHLPTTLILNPWGYNALPMNIRLEQGCTISLVVRKLPAPPGSPSATLSRVGGRLMGRTWYNAQYGGAPGRL
jgi:hypothetical protein